MRVLHVLAQRPALTGSGITLEALVRQGVGAGWEQAVVCGIPADAPHPDVGGLPAARVHPLRFGQGALDFPVPGMSDVMPYPSTRYGAMSADQLAVYRRAWTEHLRAVLDAFAPDAIYSHHVWLLSALLKELAPDLPVYTQCHATGFRQLALCPHLAEEVRAGCRRIDRFFVLHGQHRDELVRILEIPPERVTVIGAGYDPEIFHARRTDLQRAERILYVGKFAAAKGLPWLLDAVQTLARRRPGVRLDVAGAGAGPEAEALRARMRAGAPLVRVHGQLDQRALAALMRRSAVCVLPSFFEGLPLVLVEALACGCRLVATDLPGVVDHLAPHLGDVLDLVACPRLDGVDRPADEDLPAFVAELDETLALALDRPPLGDPAQSPPGALTPFTWSAVFERAQKQIETST